MNERSPDLTTPLAPCWLYTRRALSAALLSSALCFAAFTFTSTPRASGQAGSNPAQVPDESPEVAAFRQAVGGSITPMVIELRDEPGVLRKASEEQQGRTMSVEALGAYAVEQVAKQNEFMASLAQRGVRLLLREADVQQIDGSVRHVEYRFTYLLNGFVAYVADEDIARLRSLPEVLHVSEAESPVYHLDRAIDHSLGTQPSLPDRRTAVYGATQEFSPATGDATHPEAPRTTKVDGYEGQNMIVAVIDSGTDWRHPMFGGTGHTTPLPRVSGQPEAPENNKKVIYYYALSSPGDPTDDFGHGTHVASCVAGYSVDGNTPPRTGYGTGRDNLGVGPTINGAQLFGTAPQARLMAYKVCGPASSCPGDIPLAIEDAASPFTLVRSGSPGPSPVPKPVADVINLSLGSTSGDPAASNSRAANNAALAGVIVVASAGNSGPNIGTVGNPGAATLSIAVAASLDPGSIAGAGVLAPGQVADPRLPATPGPTPETGQTSNQNASQPGERQGMRIFPVAGGGPLPAESTPAQPVENNSGSVSAHYVFVDRRNAADPVPTTVGNRIALVKFTGPFAGAANTLAAQPVPPSAILLITNVENATAVQVIRGIPTFTINEDDGNYLIDRMLTGDTGDGDNNVDVPQGTISELPMRLQEVVSNVDFNGVMAGFSSRGPNDHPNADYRVLKPDVTAPGVGVVGAATVEGLPDETIGMASTSGYVAANGTSFSGPITAGAMALIRQRVREELGLDSTDPADRAKRFDTVTVARALLQNTATNLRNGVGQPQPDGASSVASVNDMGSGHINIAEALSANAIMVAPTLLLTNPSEYTPVPPATGARTVLIPTASFGSVPVVRLNDKLVRTQEVIIRDVGPNGAGAGTYALALQDNRATANNAGFQISFVASQDNPTPITSVNVPAGGEASFFVRVTADGEKLITPSEEFMWYVSATHTMTAKRLRMPFYYRAVNALLPNSAAPNQQAPQGNESPDTATCPMDSDGSYTINWTYTGPTMLRFRVQEGTFSNSIFFDNADSPLTPNAAGTTVVNENALWRDAGISGTPQTPPQWTTEVNPDTESPAYFIPNGQNQNHSLTMRNKVSLPASGLTFSFTSRESITTSSNPASANYGFVEISTDDVSWQPVLRVNGTFSGQRSIDLSGYAGQAIRVRFRYQTNLGTISGAQGWWVENIQITADDFRTIGETPANQTSLQTTNFNGTYFYRVAALYANPADKGATTVTGPYSNVRCVTVTDNPLPPPGPGAVSFGEATYSVGEAGPTATISVIREGGTAGAITVDYATSDNTATAGSDYTAASGTLTFAEGEGRKQFTITVSDDAAAEADETVNLTLSNPGGGATLGTTPTAVLTIIDNDTAAGNPGTLQFSAASYREVEDAGSATITVTRAGGSTGAVSVSYATSDGTAVANSDYTPASGTLTFAEGESTKTFTIALVDEPSAEPDENVNLTLSDPTGGATLGTPATATLTIVDTNRSDPSAVSFGEATYSVGEAGPTATISVIREGGTAGAITVDYATSDNTATAGSDYTAASGTLTFADGEARKQFTISVSNDAAVEGNETVNLTLSNPGGGATLGTIPTAVLTIIDDDTPPGNPGTLQFSAASYREVEDAGSATITVTRTGGSTGSVSVSYATSDGTAVANSDYTPASGTLTFAEGESTKTFTVALVDDPSAEPDENVNLTLSSPTGGATLGTLTTATLTILDTDRSGPPAQLLNISTRLRVRGGDSVGIGGFIVTGNGVKRIIVRGIGPSLTSDGQPLAGRLADPVVELFDGNGVSITANDNWKESPERAEIESSGLAPTHDAEAAIARTVQPGLYTAVISGKNEGEGIALIEAYDRDRGDDSEFANISTRGFADTGDNVLIGGFIAGARSGATNIVVRAIGPSLTNRGVAGALQDPTIELVDANGQPVEFSDDWKTSGDEAEITARGLAPEDDRESAGFQTVPPGNYTVIVRGKAETTGVGLVEIYNVK